MIGKKEKKEKEKKETRHSAKFVGGERT